VVALFEKYKTELNYCFDKKGVVRDVKNENSVIEKINKDEFELLVNEKVVAEGMIPKLQNAFQAIDKGVYEVIITKEDQIINAINGNVLSGTTLYKN